MKSDAVSVEQYLAELPIDRREAIAAVRDTVNRNLPDGFEEAMGYGMISWQVPLERSGKTYNGQPLTLASLASQKNHMAIYLMGVYGHEPDAEWFKARWAETGKKLDMGKSCVRFKRLDDVALDVIGEAIARTSPDDLIAHHNAAHAKR
jgi:hypothetical protein